jgi:hypothetical protein
LIQLAELQYAAPPIFMFHGGDGGVYRRIEQCAKVAVGTATKFALNRGGVAMYFSGEGSDGVVGGAAFDLGRAGKGKPLIMLSMETMMNVGGAAQ